MCDLPSVMMMGQRQPLHEHDPSRNVPRGVHSNDAVSNTLVALWTTEKISSVLQNSLARGVFTGTLTFDYP